MKKLHCMITFISVLHYWTQLKLKIIRTFLNFSAFFFLCSILRTWLGLFAEGLIDNTLDLARLSSFLSLSRTTQMLGCIFNPALLTEFQDSHLLFVRFALSRICFYLFHRSNLNMGCFLCESPCVFCINPNFLKICHELGHLCIKFRCLLNVVIMHMLFRDLKYNG